MEVEMCRDCQFFTETIEMRPLLHSFILTVKCRNGAFMKNAVFHKREYFRMKDEMEKAGRKKSVSYGSKAFGKVSKLVEFNLACLESSVADEEKSRCPMYAERLVEEWNR